MQESYEEDPAIRLDLNPYAYGGNEPGGDVCCSSCGMSAKTSAILFSAALGWWGLPWGVIGTPIQLFRDIRGLFSSPDPMRYSQELAAFVRIGLATKALESEQVFDAAIVDEPNNDG